MNQPIDQNSWVYVVVQNPGKDESIVGQKDPENKIHFIPVFRDKDAATQGLGRLVREPAQSFEIQAILHEDLLKYAQKDGFLIFFLDATGRILSKWSPDGRPL